MAKLGKVSKAILLTLACAYLTKRNKEKLHVETGKPISEIDKESIENHGIFKVIAPINKALWILHPQKALDLLILQKTMHLIWIVAKKVLDK